MSLCLRDVVRYRSDRLFQGAVNIDWFLEDEVRREAAARSFVFHGPAYHGVAQSDVGHGHGHRLHDTATFTRDVLRRCAGQEEQPFTLAIAGYGTGKSHLGLSLAVLLSQPGGDAAENILSGLEIADKGVAGEVRAMLREMGKPCLVVALNGMRSFDLTAEVTRQILHQLRSREIETRALEELQPRFAQAASLVQMSNESVVRELLDHCDLPGMQDVLDALHDHDEGTYSAVHGFFSARGMPIRALGGESVRDVIEVACRDYCGQGKPFARLVILFDEFGRYTEFATVRSQIAGSGALQDLFEGVQSNSDRVCVVGFIQFELNAYVQRVAPEHRNEILRYVTRYQSANKAYLSINLETLIASLLEKRRPELLADWFDQPEALAESKAIAGRLATWFPQVRNYQLWTDADRFHTVIRKGCWPLTPFASWLLFYLTAAGKHLQERSALTLLGGVLARHEDSLLAGEQVWSLSPVDLWSDELQQELLTSEESGQQGSITHSYAAALGRHESRLNAEPTRILQAVVLASKLGLRVANRDEAVQALAEIAGLPHRAAERSVAELRDEYNVLEWDEGFKQFDILGDAVPRTQFLSFVRQRVASSYDEEGKAQLFASKAGKWCELLGDLECDFAEENSITTREWRFQGVTANLTNLPTHIQFACQRWAGATAVDDARGTVIYCYVEPNSDADALAADARKLLRTVARQAGASAFPALVVLLCDEEGKLGQALAELAVLDESLSNEDRVRFGNLVGAHVEKTVQIVRTLVDAMIKGRRYVTCLREDLSARRLSRAGAELFGNIYNKPLPFPFDGFSTARGNAADTCQQLTSELLAGSLDFNALIAMPAKVKNRGVTVLRDSWRAFTQTGVVSRRPGHAIPRGVTERWDKALNEEGRLALTPALREICHPPYGANVASAALLLGVYVAPRCSDLGIVINGQQLSVSQWLQQGVFRGKFLDLAGVDGVELVVVGEGSTEWEELLDEWEQAGSYLERQNSMERARELKARIPVPPALGYRVVHLEEQGRQAVEALNRMDEEQNTAISKMEDGYSRGNVNKLSWGAAELTSICERMRGEQPLWSAQQIEELQPHIERARQTVIQTFSEWLAQQMPRGDSPEAVGDFKHMMVRLLGGNLKRLGLESLYDEAERHTMQLVRQAETAAEVRQLLRDVRSWLDQNADACRVVRIAHLRGLVDVGRDYSNKLQGMARRIELEDLSNTRTRLADFLGQLRDAESAVSKRAARLWNAKLRDADGLQNLSDEVEELVPAFEGCAEDVEDLHIMRKVLVAYRRAWSQLQDTRLTWAEFEALAVRLKLEMETSFGDEEIPWPIPETFECFVKELTKSRKTSSKVWVDELAAAAAAVAELSTAEANRLHDRAQSPPACLTERDSKRVTELLAAIEDRLSALAVEWLLERFRQLPPSSRSEFLKAAAEMLNG